MSSTYSPREVVYLIDTYTDNPCLETVDRLAVKLNKPRKSIISKLSKEGVYISRGYLSKTGEPPVSKLAIVRTIEDALDNKFPGLDKTPKTTLKLLSDTILDLASLTEEALGEIEVDAIRQEMLRQKK